MPDLFLTEKQFTIVSFISDLALFHQLKKVSLFIPAQAMTSLFLIQYKLTGYELVRFLNLLAEISTYSRNFQSVEIVEISLFYTTKNLAFALV